jgi:tetratricopeptide (TPR) repeat protein
MRAVAACRAQFTKLPPVENQPRAKRRLRTQGAGLVFFLALAIAPSMLCASPPPQSADEGDLANEAASALQNQNYAHAIECYKKLLPLVGPNAELLSNLGIAYHLNGQLDLARKTFLKALALNGALASPKLFLGIEYEMMSSPHEAIKYLSQSVQQNPGDANARKWLAESYADAGDYSKSIAQLQSALQNGKPDSEMLYLLGESYLKLAGSQTVRLAQVAPASYLTLLIRAENSAVEGNPDDALAYYGDVLALHPDSTDAGLRIAEILSAKGDVEGALAACRKALAENPDDPKTNLLMANLLNQQGHPQAMVVFLQHLAYLGCNDDAGFRALMAQAGSEPTLPDSQSPPPSSLCKSLEDCQTQAGTLAGANHFEAARQLLVNAAKFGPLPPAAVLLLARCQFRTRRYADLIETLSSVVAPKNPPDEALILLGRAQLESGDAAAASKNFAAVKPSSDRFPEALYFLFNSYGQLAHQTFDRLAEVDPDSALVHLVMAETFAAKNDVPHAVEEYTKVLQIKPDARLIHLAIGNLYWEAYEDDKALEQYNLELKANPNNAAVNLALGRAYLDKRQGEQALHYLLAAAGADPSMGDTQLELGKTYLLLKQPARAVPVLEAFVRQAPNDKTGHFKLSQACRLVGLTARADSEMAYFARLDQAARQKPLLKADRMREIEQAERDVDGRGRTADPAAR